MYVYIHIYTFVYMGAHVCIGKLAALRLVQPNVVAYNAAISACEKTEQWLRALSLLEDEKLTSCTFWASMMSPHHGPIFQDVYICPYIHIVSCNSRIPQKDLNMMSFITSAPLYMHILIHFHICIYVT